MNKFTFLLTNYLHTDIHVPHSFTYLSKFSWSKDYILEHLITHCKNCRWKMKLMKNLTKSSFLMFMVVEERFVPYAPFLYEKNEALN